LRAKNQDSFVALPDTTPLRSPISDEEIERRCQQRTGKPLAEILDRLKLAAWFIG
jgi:hypothetical protein